MPKVLNGKKEAEKIYFKLEPEVKKLNEDGVIPTLHTFLLTEDKASEKFLSLKKKAAEKVGAKIKVVKKKRGVNKKKILEKIKRLNESRGVDGIMIQMPFPPSFEEKDKEELINTISKKKDVDGMRDDGSFVAPVVKAVLFVLREGSGRLRIKGIPRAIIVGNKGFVGAKIETAFKEMGYEIEGIDVGGNLKSKTKNADILISATGKTGLIGPEEVKKGSLLIDVGAPKGDFKESAYKKAAFVSPVPGGIGPLTVAFLIENLVMSAKESQIAK